MKKEDKYFGLVDKNGKSNFKTIGLKKSALSDLHHHFIRKSWSQFSVTIFFIYIVINLFFAILYNFFDGLDHADSFTDYFFFSVQTLGTIGYGYIYPKVDSYATNLIVSLEAYIGILFTAFVTGLFYSKFSLPRAKVAYTEKAVVYMDNEQLTLKFRIANTRESQIVDANLSATLIKLIVNKDGTKIRKMFDMKLERSNIPTVILTFVASHIIDEDSPFFGETHQSLVEKQAFMGVSIIGVDEITSQTIHSRYFYSFEDIIWNAKFEDMIFKDKDGSNYIDYRNFNKINIL
ncbi:MAG: ion channel [Candidatus Sericytochromatia bacterium]